MVLEYEAVVSAEEPALEQSPVLESDLVLVKELMLELGWASGEWRLSDSRVLLPVEMVWRVLVLIVWQD